MNSQDIREVIFTAVTGIVIMFCASQVKQCAIADIKATAKKQALDKVGGGDGKD